MLGYRRKFIYFPPNFFLCIFSLQVYHAGFQLDANFFCFIWFTDGCRLSADGQDFFTSYDEVYESFDAMGLQENLLRGIYAYGRSHHAFIVFSSRIWVMIVVDNIGLASWICHLILLINLNSSSLSPMQWFKSQCGSVVGLYEYLWMVERIWKFFWICASKLLDASFSFER